MKRVLNVNICSGGSHTSTARAHNVNSGLAELHCMDHADILQLPMHSRNIAFSKSRLKDSKFQRTKRWQNNGTEELYSID